MKSLLEKRAQLVTLRDSASLKNDLEARDTFEDLVKLVELQIKTAEKSIKELAKVDGLPVLTARYVEDTTERHAIAHGLQWGRFVEVIAAVRAELTEKRAKINTNERGFIDYV